MSPIFILPPNSLLLFHTPIRTSSFTPHLPMPMSTTLVMSLNLLSPLPVPNTSPATSFISHIPIIPISLLSNTLRPPFISRSPIPCPPMCMQFMHTIPHYPPQAFSCNVQLAHACSLPRSLPYLAASACHGEDRWCNPHTVFPSAFLSRALTHTGSGTMATKRLKELLETRKPSAHENSSITNGNETNGQSNEWSLQRQLGYELEVMVNMQNKWVCGESDRYIWIKKWDGGEGVKILQRTWK